MIKFNIRTAALAAVTTMALVLGVTTHVQAQGDAKDVTMQKRIDDVRQRAQSLSERHTAIRDALQRAKDSAEVSKLLDDSLRLAGNVVEIYSENNEIWKLHSETLQVVEDQIKDAQKQLQTDVRWVEVVKAYQERRDTLQQVRIDLLKQRATAEGALTRVTADRTLILAQLKLDAVDKAITELRNAVQEMGGFADALTSTLDRLDPKKKVGSPS